jgi:hypothetical protein
MHTHSLSLFRVSYILGRLQLIRDILQFLPRTIAGLDSSSLVRLKLILGSAVAQVPNSTTTKFDALLFRFVSYPLEASHEFVVLMLGSSR